MLSEEIDQRLNPKDCQDAFTEKLRTEYGYLGAKRLEDGSYVAANRLMFTVAIYVGVDPLSFKRRYCFEDFSEFLANYEGLRSINTPVSGYIATRPVPDGATG